MFYQSWKVLLNEETQRRITRSPTTTSIKQIRNHKYMLEYACMLNSDVLLIFLVFFCYISSSFYTRKGFMNSTSVFPVNLGQVFLNSLVAHQTMVLVNNKSTRLMQWMYPSLAIKIPARGYWPRF